MREEQKNTALAYAVAVASAICAVAVRLLLDPVFGRGYPLVTLFGAVAATAWYGGTRPAIVSAVLGYLACAYLFMDPRGAPFLGTPRDLLGLIAYLATCALIIGFGSSARMAERRARKVREALDETQRLQQLVSDHAPVLIAHADADGRYKFVNRPFAARFNLEPKDIVGKLIPEIVGDAAFAAFEPHVRSVLSGNRVEFEMEIPYRDVGPQFMHVSYAPEWADGKVVGFIAAIANITERRLAAEKLGASERQGRAILESISDAFFSLDQEWRFSYINPAAARLLGRSAAELQGRILWDEYADLVGGEIEQMYRRVREKQVAESLTTYYPAHERWYEIRTFPAPEGLSVYFRDVSEPVRVEAILRATEKRRRLALDSAGLGAWSIDAATGVLSTDERFQAIFSGTNTALGYDAAVSVIHPDDRERIKNAVIAAMTPPNPAPYSEEYRVVRPDGKIVWVYAKGGANFEGEGAARRLVSFDGTLADISDRKLAETQLRDDDRRKDEFLATLAHELRNPLAPMRNSLEIIRLSPGKPVVIDQARGVIERQLLQMVRLVDDLLDVSRISRGTLELRRERVVLATVIASAAEASRPLLNANGIELSIALPSAPVYLHADLVRLAQVFLNLLNNAAKFTDRAGRVELTAEVQEGFVVVTVRDNGVGIDPRNLKLIFEMFAQVDSSLERSRGGLGIGLTLVRRLVELHGGQVEARSAGRRKGSEFVVRLPTLAAPDALVSTPAGSAPAPKLPLRVLVVDDNEDSAASLSMILTLAGHESRAVHDGFVGLAEAQAFRPDVILLDIGLPLMSGYEVARRIRATEWGRAMFLVALTGWGQDEDKRKTSDAGFDHHLVKPAEPKQIERLLARVAGQSRSDPPAR